MTATGSESAAPALAADDAGSGKRGAIEQAGEQRSTRLESLRALGWLAVLVAHVLTLALAYQGLGDTYKNRLMLGGGVLGLYLFFAMSGYLLYLPFARRQLCGERRIDVRRYARNRMLRILPVYYLVIAVLLIVQPLDADRGDWWRWLTFTQNFSAETIHRLNAPLWSVVVEVQFYIALPLMAWAVAKLGGRSFPRTVAVLAGIALASWIIRSREVVNAAEPNIIGPLGKYALPSFLYAFMGGMLLAVLRLAWERRPPRWAQWPVVGASGAWIAAAVGLHLLIAYDFDYQEPWVALVAALIVGACVLPLRTGVIVNILERRPLAVVGVASFSLYLWHWPILQALSGVHFGAAPGEAVGIVGEQTDFKGLLAVGLPLCVAVGLASYWIIERPFLRRRRGWGTTEAAPTADAPVAS
ncbi:MAG: acyltransferase, partial [Actinomycetota bacterium]|nr:acyltransferase [Actinomycetota bacterium]